jgi:hypothetical protein
VEITLGVIVWCGKVLGEEDMDGEGFRKRGHHLSTHIRDGIDLVPGKIYPKKQGNTGDIDQDHNNQIDEKPHVIP